MTFFIKPWQNLDTPTHPLHPTLTHLPFGLVIGAFLFALVAMLFRWTNLIQTARYCLILALIMVVPTTLLGIMDWQHFYGGAMLFPIKMKLTLTGLLLIFAVVFGRLGDSFNKVVFGLNLLCLLATVGLGYFGGELVYGTKTAAAGVSKGSSTEGAIVFQQNCSACHLTDSTATKNGPGLKGIFERDKFPVSGQPVTERNFREQLITPFSKMPSFDYLPEEQVDVLIAYLKTL